MALSLEKHQTVVFPRFRIEEDLVDIQAASREASTNLERGARLYEDGRMAEGRQSLAAADTLVRLIDFTANRLADDITHCPDGLAGPDGHAA